MDRLYGFIKKMAYLAVILMMVASCGIVKPVVIRDSTNVIINYKDSINFIDSTVYHHLYKEVYNDYSDMLDTLNLEDTYSKAQAYLDTANKKLKGSIKTKDKDVPVPIKWKEKIVYRDSLVYIKEEVPVPYPVEKKYIPKFYKFCLFWFIATLAGIAALIYIKFFIK